MNFRPILFTMMALPALWPQAAPRPDAAAAAPRIEVCFVLDTTGSMGGLIEGAKQKIWSIANQMVSATPAPQLKIALVGYRDKGDEYVVRRYDLNSDIDAVYSHLQEFTAGGGGDSPESVNQALQEAVSRISWSRDRSVLKIVFLVGDSPPHMDYQDDVKYPSTCELAVRNDLILNTIQCGSNRETTPVWQAIADRGEGKFVAIGQTGDMQVVSAPMDAELAGLNAAIGRTLVPYGAPAVRQAVLSKQAASEAAAAPVAADRLAYNAGTGKVVQGGGDLVDAMKDKKIKLAEIRTEDLPREMQDLAPEKREEFLRTRANERERIQARIRDLLQQRQAFIQQETRRLAGKGGFDEQVRNLVVEQAKAKGILIGAGPDKKLP